MDIQQVIAELRAELESVDLVVVALERLVDLRTRRGGEVNASAVQTPARPPRTRKSSPPPENAASASVE